MVASTTLHTGPKDLRGAFTNKNTHPLALDLVLVKEFGPEYLGWEPETCWEEIKLTWGTTVSEINKSKIQAIRTCHVSYQPYERWSVFEKVCSGFMGVSPRFDFIQKPTPHRATVSLDIMIQVKDKKSISEEIYKYVAAAMLDYGMVYGHGSLEPCNKYLTKFVNPKLQDLIKSKVTRKKNLFSGRSEEEDVQAMKSISVADFSESSSRLLLTQLEQLLA